jgi:hypothetical protein
MQPSKIGEGHQFEEYFGGDVLPFDIDAHSLQQIAENKRKQILLLLV